MTYWDCFKQQRFALLLGVATYLIIQYLLNSLSWFNLVFVILYPLFFTFVTYYKQKKNLQKK